MKHNATVAAPADYSTCVMNLYQQVNRSYTRWTLTDCILFVSHYFIWFDEPYMWGWIKDDEPAIFDPTRIRHIYDVYHSRKEFVDQYEKNPFWKNWFSDNAVKEYDELTFWSELPKFGMIGPLYTPTGEYTVFIEKGTVPENENEVQWD